ncbi:hypothetical protein HanRHA438_Chr01g0028291 [Helianthus annuus]|nr:hypothetical protein HanHA300_Chr01g0022441 [Helianthus annuus]KAJ0948526.1 hypothetical protein HanRHA438_Chr01g0028291 [Helianthus annuus]KAJ0957395.1 hypothetical protein HanPSC8_Chr01g0026841 [Helianthus annuus]
MCENATRAFNFRECILAMGGLSPFYTICPKAYLSGNGESFAGCAMDVIPGDEVPHAEGQEMNMITGWDIHTLVAILALLLAKGKGQEENVVPVEAVVDTSPPQDFVQSITHFPSSSCVHSPLVPLFADGCPSPYVSGWKITSSSVISTREIARDFMSHALPPSQKFMNAVLDLQIFEDQYCMAMCDSFSGVLGCLSVLRC